jgi:hypothetical protein
MSYPSKYRIDDTLDTLHSTISKLIAVEPLMYP